MRRLKFKNIFVLFLISILPSSLFAGDSDLACNPDANCLVIVWVPCGTLQYPFRTCPGPSSDEPTCAAMRAACRTKCGQLNDDANRHIGIYQTRQTQIQATLKVNAALANTNINLIQQNEAFKSNNSNLCSQFQNYILIINKQKEIRDNFVQALTEVVNSNNPQFFSSIDKLKIANVEVDHDLKNYIKTIFLTSGKSLIEVQKILNEYSQNSATIPLEELLKDSSIKCEKDQVNQETLALASLNEQKYLIESSTKDLNTEFSYLSGLIQQQEARKCH